MKTNFSPSDKQSSEYENPSHIVKRKKALESQFVKKNIKSLKELIHEEDEEFVEEYIRYIR